MFKSVFDAFMLVLVDVLNSKLVGAFKSELTHEFKSALLGG